MLMDRSLSFAAEVPVTSSNYYIKSSFQLLKMNFIPIPNLNSSVPKRMKNSV